ncbi:MAG TPA: hypothetical protein VEI97_01710 [bacterium]|nr:hypothetical protein [bacterium]
MSNERTHQLERVADGIVEGINRRVEILVRYWHAGDRVAFTRLLNKYELAARYADPALRQEIVADLTLRIGPEAAAEFLDAGRKALLEIEDEAVGG